MIDNYALWRTWAQKLKDEFLNENFIYYDADLLCRIISVYDDLMREGRVQTDMRENIDMLIGRLTRNYFCHKYGTPLEEPVKA